MTTPKWKSPDTPNNDWIGEKILATEDTLMEHLAKAHFDKMDGKERETPPPATNAQDLPVDPTVEYQAYADLLAHFAEHPEDDCEVTMLTPQEFAEDTFTLPADNTCPSSNALRQFAA